MVKKVHIFANRPAGRVSRQATTARRARQRPEKRLIMKKSIILAWVVIASAGLAWAQPAKEIVKQRKETAALSRIERHERIVKAAHKEARSYAKADWVVFPGQLPLEKQMERAFAMRYELDRRLFPRYVLGEAISTGETYEAATADAIEWAKLNMAEQIQTEIGLLIERGLAERLLTTDEAAAISEVVMADREVIAVSIGRVIPVVTCRRGKASPNNEVCICIAYGSEMAIEGAGKALRRELDRKGATLYEQLTRITKIP